MPAYHTLNRTSPKGPGMPFIGTCSRCGEKNLPSQAVNWECPNTRNVSDDDALIEIIEGTEPKP